MLITDFDLLCILKVSDMEKDIHELFHLVFKTKHEDTEDMALMKKFSSTFMKRFNKPRHLLNISTH